MEIKPTKITFVLPGYPWKPIGGFRVVYEYANHLVARGHEIAIVHPRRLPNWSPPPPNFYFWLRKKAACLRNLILKPKVCWQPIDTRVKMLYVPEPTERYIPDADVVFATFWPTAELVLQYPPNKGKKFYLLQDFYPYLGTKSQIEKTWWFPLKKVAISNWLYKIVISGNIPEGDIVAIPIGVDYKRFRIQNDIADRPKKIAMMYSTALYKAPEDGIKAMEIVKSEYKDLEAICFGPSHRPKTLPRWIKYETNVSEERLVEIYNFSSIFLSSSVVEGFAFPPAESMACGCAVVATDSGGIREFAEHEKTALLSPPKDPDALANNLLRVLKDDNLRIHLAKAGYERIQQFTWERSTNLLEQFILQRVKKDKK